MIGEPRHPRRWLLAVGACTAMLLMGWSRPAAAASVEDCRARDVAARPDPSADISAVFQAVGFQSPCCCSSPCAVIGRGAQLPVASSTTEATVAPTEAHGESTIGREMA